MPSMSQRFPKGTAPSNNGLHQTGRGGAVASRPVVEARPAGEAGCCTGMSLVGQS